MKPINPKKYPKEIWIRGESYKILFKPIEDFGTCDPQTREITIRVGLKRSTALKTLIHEILHALDFEYETGIQHKVIHRLEQPIYRFLLDNF